MSTAGGIAYCVLKQRTAEAARLQTISNLKVREIGEWLAEREKEAEFLGSSPDLLEVYRKSCPARGPCDASPLLQLLEQYRRRLRIDAISLLDADGHRLCGTSRAPVIVPPALEAAARDARKETRLRPVGPYLDKVGEVRLDFVAPMQGPEKAALPLFVVHVNPSDWLFPTLRAWPVPSASGEAVLVRRDADQVLFLSELHERKDAAALRISMWTATLPAAKVLRGERPQDALVTGRDYRDVPVLAVMRGIPNTDWFLVAKVDRAEAYAPAAADAGWIALAGVLALLTTLGGDRWLRQQQELASATRVHLAQEQHLARLKETEEALRKSQAQLMAFISQAPISIAMFDRNMNYLAVSGRWLQEYGRGYTDLIGRNHYDVHPDVPPEWKAVHQQALAGATLANDHDKWTQADGSAHWLRWATLPWFDEGGHISGIIISAEDITERMSLSEELERHRNHLEALVEIRTAELQEVNDKLLATQFAMDSVGIAIHWVDPATGRFVYVNRVAAGMLGYTVDEMLRLTVPQIDPDFEGERFGCVIEHIRRRGHAKFESSARAKDGSRIPVEVNVYWLTSQGDGTPRVVSFLTDISLRKESEAALMQARDAAEAANAAKSAFLANMSHEIRTPMNAIMGLAYLLRSADPRPEQADRLDKISQAARHLLSIINDILDLSKIEAGKLVLERADFPVTAILDQVYSLIADEARAKGLTAEVDRGHVPFWINGDQTRLRQALLNYASNAVKFTQRGGICLRSVLLEDRGAELLVRFEVEDTGIGIAPDKLSGLFQPFHQADTSTTRKFGGTGLGLAITQRLARLMGGEAGARSEPGKGSTFWFTARLGRGAFLAPADGNSQVADAESELRRRHAGARILLAEDDPVNQEVALALMADTGLNIDVVDDGRRAVEKASAGGYDLILMDMQMSEMDGLEATREIRALPGAPRVPIVAMTANAFDDDRRRCFEAGMNDFIGKPVDPSMLFTTLLRWLSKRPGHAVLPAACAEHRPATADDDLRHRLAGINGLDAQVGLRALQGNARKYLELLQRFCQEHRDDMSCLFGSLATGDPRQARHVAHRLKGAAATLGLRLQDEAARLEAAVLAGGSEQQIGEFAERIVAELARLAAAVAAIGPCEAAQAPVDGDRTTEALR